MSTVEESPSKFVKPADLFRMRHSTNSMPAFSEAQSPLKCLNNLADPSPTKKLPTLLRNPFNQPVKRKLNLQSPNKRTKMFEIDEDANLEPPPKMKAMSSANNLSNQFKLNDNTSSSKPTPSCYFNNWTLKTKLKITFHENTCKNWNNLTSSTHKRAKNSPSKLNDNTISIEAIKNISTFYQHPYLAWLPLFPRANSLPLGSDYKNTNFELKRHSEVTQRLCDDWCESLDDLINLLIDGKCPYFYMCSDISTILFKQIPSSNPKKPFVQAYISPLSTNLGSKLNELGIEIKLPETTTTDINRTNSSSNLDNSFMCGRDQSTTQDSMASRQQNNSFKSNFDEDTNNSQFGLKSSRSNNCSKVISIDSGNGSMLDELDNFDEENEQDEPVNFLIDCLNLPKEDFPTIGMKRPEFHAADQSNTQTKHTADKPLALIEGSESLRKLVDFLKSNRKYTTQNVGKFACIPPTLLSPCEFRLSTPQYPKVTSIQNMIENNKTTARSKASGRSENCSMSKPKQQAAQKSDNIYLTPKKNSNVNSKNLDLKQVGPTIIELQGAILPNIYEELHKLLLISDNTNHTCQAAQVHNPSTTFASIPFNSDQTNFI